jgi:hypothetical protein
MAMQLSDNLTKGVGEQGNDLALLRSFSLLVLTSIVYEDITYHWLEKSSVKQLLDQALIYLAAEKDLRGVRYGKRLGACDCSCCGLSFRFGLTSLY